MEKILIFGHKNPDVDSICSAIVLSEFKKTLGLEVEAVRLGNMNEETKFALETFGVEPPRLIHSLADETPYVILVDHNEFQHSADGIEEARILEVIDHHRIANFQTNEPLYYRCEPVGCTATIIYTMHREKEVILTKPMAGLLLSAIISDTLLFKSPTCTPEDVLVAKRLAEVAEVDTETYGLELLKAGTKLDSKTVEELISLDEKSFQLGMYQVTISQVNTLDPEEVYERQIELEEVMKNRIKEEGIHLFIFSATNILTKDSTVLVLGSMADVVEEAFKVKLEERKAKLKNVVSRKKQLLPALSDVFKKRELY